MIQFIIDNKEIFFSGLGATVIGILIRSLIKKKKKSKTVIHKHITNKTINNNTTTTTNTTTNNTTTNNSNNKNQYNSHSHGNKAANKKDNNQSLELTRIQLYSTGAKGKVFTKKFHKSLNHNFGIELTIKNNTAQLQNVKVGWCIYNNKGITLMQGTFYEKIKAHTSFKKDFYVKEAAFRKLSAGKYKSQFWLNDKKVQKEYFTISYK